MLVTALIPVVDYSDAARIAATANAEGPTLREAALKSGKIDEPHSTRSSTQRS